MLEKRFGILNFTTKQEAILFPIIIIARFTRASMTVSSVLSAESSTIRQETGSPLIAELGWIAITTEQVSVSRALQQQCCELNNLQQGPFSSRKGNKKLL